LERRLIKRFVTRPFQENPNINQPSNQFIGSNNVPHYLQRERRNQDEQQIQPPFQNSVFEDEEEEDEEYEEE